MNLGQDYKARFGQDFKFKFSRDADVWLRFFKLMLILKLKFDQDLCKNLYELNPWVRCAFGNVCQLCTNLCLISKCTDTQGYLYMMTLAYFPKTLL